MYTESLVKLGKVRSEIREIFEYGNKRKAEIGAEIQVFQHQRV